MKKIFSNKTVATTVIFLSIVFGSVTALASTKIGVEIVNVMRASFNVRMQDYNKEIALEQEKLIENNAVGIEDYVNASSERVLDHVENYIEEELSRAGLELDHYRDELLQQLDQELITEEERLKKLVNDYINLKIKEAKNEINDKIYQEYLNRLREHLGQ